jgi:hypothetical protein
MVRLDTRLLSFSANFLKTNGDPLQLFLACGKKVASHHSANKVRSTSGYSQLISLTGCAASFYSIKSSVKNHTNPICVIIKIAQGHEERLNDGPAVKRARNEQGGQRRVVDGDQSGGGVDAGHFVSRCGWCGVSISL